MARKRCSLGGSNLSSSHLPSPSCLHFPCSPLDQLTRLLSPRLRSSVLGPAPALGKTHRGILWLRRISFSIKTSRLEFPLWHSGLRIQCCCSCGTDCSSGLRFDPWPWELLYSMGSAGRRKKKSPTVVPLADSHCRKSSCNQILSPKHGQANVWTAASHRP